MLEQIKSDTARALLELLEVARLKEKDILVVGCSTSEVAGHRIGTFSSTEIAESIFSAIYPILKGKGIYLAAQCCEHLNRALILEEEAAEYYRYPAVNVVPYPKAGGAFSTVAYREFIRPVAVEAIQARAGMDIGDTLIGMHLMPVAVPVRVSIKAIGQAHLVCARTRRKLIGGQRAQYDDRD
ncbi:MAG TPA: TIGR01440 family protein [Candidatus Atribacteria bacterium]|nr:TIGR01440 family protein [Candidatus Atribacteria bacterium]